MKKIILTILIMASSYSFAQTNLNPRTIFGVDISNSASSTLTSSTFKRDFGKNHILRGWNWGETDTFTHKLDNTLNINTILF